jgi:mRNA interferase RelE/StbE
MPRPPGVVKMHGSEGYYRLRVGDYRVVYAIEDAVLLVLVVRIGHRRDVYR